MIPLYTPSEFEMALSRDKLSLECRQCHTPFLQSKNRIQARSGVEFCCRACQSKSQKKPRQTLLCQHCNQPFERMLSQIEESKKRGMHNHYCSLTCAGKANIAFRCLSGNPAKIRTCYRCNKLFKAEKGHKSRKACPSCWGLKKSQTVPLLTIVEIERANIGNKDRYNRIRQHCREQHADLAKKPCVKCGYDKHVELCHIRPISDWPKDTLVAAVNHRSNVIQLCRNCHWEQEHGLLDVSKIGIPTLICTEISTSVESRSI